VIGRFGTGLSVVSVITPLSVKKVTPEKLSFSEHPFNNNAETMVNVIKGFKDLSFIRR
jgi:hypothetical protein